MATSPAVKIGEYQRLPNSVLVIEVEQDFSHDLPAVQWIDRQQVQNAPKKAANNYIVE